MEKITKKGNNMETQKQQEHRLAHFEDMLKNNQEYLQLEETFTDEWLETHDFTPTYADAIKWAMERQKSTLITKAWKWICNLLKNHRDIFNLELGESHFRNEMEN